PHAGMYHIPLEGVRYGRPDCRAEAGGFVLAPVRKKALELRFPQGLFEEGGFRGVDAYDQFREAALKLEDNGCLPVGAVERISHQLIGAVSLEPQSVYYVRYGNTIRKGAINLEAGLRLKVVAPLLKPGYTAIKTQLSPNSKPGSLEVNVEGLEGFETAYYMVRPRRGGGLEFALLSVEQNRMGVITKASKPSAFHFAKAPNAEHYQLMFLRRVSIADRDIALLGAPTWKLLLETAHRFDTVAGAVNDCDKVPGLDCVAMTKQSAINSETGVLANGRMLYVPVGGNLRDVLGAAGIRDDQDQDKTLATLKVERLWHGAPVPVELDHGNAGGLGLVLIAGDRVSW
ncbi:MAG: hypothetical protein ABSC08_11750, partial [Bryobacteraceae bacterium]